MSALKRLLFLAAMASVLGWQFGRAVAEVIQAPAVKALSRALFALALALSTSIVW